MQSIFGICVFTAVFSVLVIRTAFFFGIYKTVDLRTLHRAENSVFQTLILLFKTSQQILYSLPFGIFVRRTRTFHHGKIRVVYKIFYILFGSVDKRSQKRYSAFIEICHRRKTAYSSLVEKIHHESFNRVLKMMSERYFSAAELFCISVQRAASHART